MHCSSFCRAVMGKRSPLPAAVTLAGELIKRSAIEKASFMPEGTKMKNVMENKVFWQCLHKVKLSSSAALRLILEVMNFLQPSIKRNLVSHRSRPFGSGVTPGSFFMEGCRKFMTSNINRSAAELLSFGR